MARPGLALVEADVGELGIGEGDPGERPLVDLGGQAKEHVLEHHLGVMAGEVGELMTPGDVAHRVDLAIRGPEPLVDLDAPGRSADPGALEVEGLDIGLAAHRHQQMRAFEPGLGAPGGAHRDARRRPLDAHDLGALMDRHPLVAQPGGDHAGELGIVPSQHLEHLDDRDPGAQPAEGLGKLDPDRAAADHDQVLGPLAKLEDGLVGEIGRLTEARQRRHRRRRAGGYHDPAGGDQLSARADLGGAGKAGLGLDHIDAETPEAGHRIVGRDGGDDLVDVVVDGGEVDLGQGRDDAEARALAYRLGGSCRREQRLGGDAAVVQAIAPHLAALDQRHSRAHQAGAGGDREAARTGADDTEVNLHSFDHPGTFLAGRSGVAGFPSFVAVAAAGLDKVGSGGLETGLAFLYPHRARAQPRDPFIASPACGINRGGGAAQGGTGA